MKKLTKRLKIVSIDVDVYVMSVYKEMEFKNREFILEKEELKKGKIRYFIENSSGLIHESFLFPKVFLMRALNRKGPVIGDCKTTKVHRGKSIYPFVINRIAKEIIENRNESVYIIANRSNLSSLKGIEKANFTILASILAKRWLWFYLKKEIVFY